MKRTADGVEIPSRVYYYLLDYIDQKESHQRLCDLSSKEVLELLDEAMHDDKNLMRRKSCGC